MEIKLKLLLEIDNQLIKNSLIPNNNLLNKQILIVSACKDKN